uniref:Uncharacterized protein n=1 Tax=Eutreptiella gymnastica TaxID=73025 RepID=A0A7S1JAB4_9EUGL
MAEQVPLQITSIPVWAQNEVPQQDPWCPEQPGRLLCTKRKPAPFVSGTTLQLSPISRSNTDSPMNCLLDTVTSQLPTQCPCTRPPIINPNL